MEIRANGRTVIFRDEVIRLILNDIKVWSLDFLNRVSKNKWFDATDCVSYSSDWWKRRQNPAISNASCVRYRCIKRVKTRISVTRCDRFYFKQLNLTIFKIVIFWIFPYTECLIEIHMSFSKSQFFSCSYSCSYDEAGDEEEHQDDIWYHFGTLKKRGET